MSDQIDKVKQQINQQIPKTNKKFDSKSLNHLNQYSIVKYFLNIILQFSIIQILYKQLILPIYNFININIISITPIYNLFTLFDSIINEILIKFDYYFLNLPQQQLQNFEKNFIKPINSKIIEINNHYLTPLENKTEDGIFQIFYTLKSILLNITSTTINKGDEIQKTISSTFNKELQQQNSKDLNFVNKNINASINTFNKTYNTFNEEVLIPIKQQTQELYASGYKRGENLIADTKEKINPKLEEYKTKAENIINNNTPVQVSG
ncbi:uncharacterized protein KGF55_002351 [Candida pseudojiufengensis]|uniref:uncharacterized protein n=1 Tax=Candida pseudojiufengensis TaxID=497109 RepID=UPI002224346B|nr:uncharacterized protein KGF55_002351 [Candida pseudojiufengensis]KAI5963471.1 hypothetical protein KGF55_002351 [Candida pseudojiufengensis]